MWVETTTFLPVLGGGEDGRDEVGEALADAGAGLDDQVARPLDGLGDGVGHLELLGRAPRSSAAGVPPLRRVRGSKRGPVASCGRLGKGNHDAVQLRPTIP